MDFDEVKHLVGEFFHGQYEVKKFLGEGSFAKVYLVKHNYLDDMRAMKIIKEPVSHTTNTKSIFKEVMIATQLRHENIISIYDAGIMSSASEDSNDLAFFVMEYVQGGDLEQYLNSFINSDLLMPINRVLNLIYQILMGLNTLHMSNPKIVHRDLKLNNILISFNACGEITVKISDFGFSKEITTNISDIDIVGTRPYMAPECFNKEISTMTDIYAVGVIFYQLLTNNFPYAVDEYDVEEILDLKPWDMQPKPPSRFNSNVSKHLDEIVMKCLQINPKDRYQNAAELLAEVEMLANSQPISQEANIDNINIEEHSGHVLNDSLREAFRLAKCENKLWEAIEILESEVLRDYDVRRYYSETLQMWKSKYPDVKLVSKAFTVNLTAKNYKLACDLLSEAMAYNPSIKNKYNHFIDLWKIFIDLSKDGNLLNAVLRIEELMDSNRHIAKIYAPIINTLKTYSVEEIVAKANHLVGMNNLVDASNLMEVAILCDLNVRKKYEYKLSLWKQNMKSEFEIDKNPRENSVDFAIDLGTTDSIISYYNNAKPIIIKNHKTGDDLTPSAVLIDEANNIHVGEDAKNALLVDNDNAISEFKQNMGFAIPFNFQNASCRMQPEELSAEILKDLRRSAYHQLGVNPEHVVVCVPANSNYIRTKSINDACELAGFRSHGLLLEPIAVSIAYELSSYNDGTSNCLVYDLGGATLSISLLNHGNGEIRNVDSIRHDNFGGNAFDWAIVNELFVPKITGELNLDDFTVDNPKYKKTFAQLKIAAENSKKVLSNYGSTDISLNNLLGNYDFTYHLTQEELKEIMAPLIKPTFNLVENLLDKNSISSDEVDKIILVGGSCISPTVQKLIGENLDIEVEHGIDPLTVVAIGASIYAGSLEKPKVDITDYPFSVILNIDGGNIEGRVFTLDERFSFLGLSIEFANDGYSSGRIDLDLDGTFKIPVPTGECEIRIYDNDEPVVMDKRSPISIKDDAVFIEYLNDDFPIDADGSTRECTIKKYDELMASIDYLNDYSRCIDEIDLMEYVDRLIEILEGDVNALALASIYVDYLMKIVSKEMHDLRFLILLGNVENKMMVAKEADLFDISGLEANLPEITKTKDFEKLDAIHKNLIDEYVKSNKKDVLISCFFNLKTEGIYTNNLKSFDELSKRASEALNDQDYGELFLIVKGLYEIDERFHGRGLS